MNNTRFKVSVCIVTYNQEAYIEECLQSVVDQKVDFAFEVIINDDCSTDKTPEIIQKFAEKYSYIKANLRSKNVGASKNFIEAHNSAVGEYVCHLDGDDRWLQGKLQAQADFLDSESEMSVCWTRANYFDDDGNFFRGENYDYSMFEDGLVTFEQGLRLGAVAVHSSVMYRSNCRITRDPELQLLDIYCAWEFLSQGYGKILDSVYVDYRVNSIGAVSVKSNKKIKGLYAEHSLDFLNKFPESKKSIFVFSLINMIVDLKNLRPSSWAFAKLCIKSLSYISLKDLKLYFLEAKKLSTPKLK